MEENTVQEQAVVEITTRIDYEEYKKYAKHVHLKGKNILTLAASCLLFLFALVFLLFVIRWGLDFFEFSLSKPIFAGILWGTGFFLFLYLAFTFYFAYMAYFVVKRSYKTYQRAHEADCHEVFYEDYILSRKELPEVASESRIRYDYYTEAVETQSAFYLTIAMGKNTHGILPKSYMTPEQIDALRELLARKFGDKFKQYNKK